MIVVEKINLKKEEIENPIIRGSVDNFLQNISLMVEGIASIFGKHCEVVLHDLRKPERSIVAIANGHVTGRKIGGPIIGGPQQDKGLKVIMDQAGSTNVVSNYTTRTNDGRTLKSTSIFFRNPKGTPILALCINLDLTEFDRANELLGNICLIRQDGGFINSGPKDEENSHTDVAMIIKSIVDDSLININKPIHMMDKDDKLNVIKIMYERGLFLIKGGVDHAAKALCVSRFTVYNYLKELSIRRQVD